MADCMLQADCRLSGRHPNTWNWGGATVITVITVITDVPSTSPNPNPPHPNVITVITDVPSPYILRSYPPILNRNGLTR